MLLLWQDMELWSKLVGTLAENMGEIQARLHAVELIRTHHSHRNRATVINHPNQDGQKVVFLVLAGCSIGLKS